MPANCPVCLDRTVLVLRDAPELCGFHRLARVTLPDALIAADFDELGVQRAGGDVDLRAVEAALYARLLAVQGPAFRVAATRELAWIPDYRIYATGSATLSVDRMIAAVRTCRALSAMAAVTAAEIATWEAAGGSPMPKMTPWED
jgi:hypothetical protein